MEQENSNIVSALYAVAVGQGQKTALTALEGGQWQHTTFAELERNSRAYAALLHTQGLVKGDRVMLMVRPSMDFICLTFALFHLGAVVILIDPGMGYRNLLRCIASVRPDILIAVPPVVLLSRIFYKPFKSIRKRFVAGATGMPSGLVKLLGLRLKLKHPEQLAASCPPPHVAASDDLAAIIFTTGSTGPPKGVRYTHGIFHTQLGLIRDHYGIDPNDVDQPGFPLFGLFSTALGARAVIPDMDPTRPAQVDPQKFVASLEAFRVSYSFGSPAIWRVVSAWCLEQGKQLNLRKILMAGSPVPGDLVERLFQILPKDAHIHTPYGATESLPVASIEGREIITKTWPMTRIGKGACVGWALPGMDIRIIAPVDGVIERWEDARELPAGTIGEIVVRGPVVTAAYDGLPEATRMAKISDTTDGAPFPFWHRMGDMGYLDEKQRLWFCGRMAHRVQTPMGVLYTIPCEAIFNEHPQVMRSALVGVGADKKRQTPVIIVELKKDAGTDIRLLVDLRNLALANTLTKEIRHFLIHPAFPVDIRHNAKIFREKLALWAKKYISPPPGC